MTTEQLPPGFREGHNGDLACPHRDVSCCDLCEAKYPEIVDVVGAHFWVPDPVERGQLAADLSDYNADKAERAKR